MDNEFKRFIVMVVGIIVLVITMVLLFFSVASIPANHVGVVFNRADGGINEEPVKSGWRFHAPFLETVYDVSTYTHALHLKPGTDKEGAAFDDSLVTQTKDGQWLAIEAEVQYRILPENAIEVFEQFKSNNGEIDDNLKEKMPSIIQRAVERVTSKYDVVEALGEKRAEMQEELELIVSEELIKYGITLQSFTLVDTDAGDEIEAAIAQEAVEQQNIATAKQHQEKARINNQTELEKAQAEAERKQIQAEAEAKANKELSDSVTPELVSYLEAQARQKFGWVTVQGISDIMVDAPN